MKFAGANFFKLVQGYYTAVVVSRRQNNPNHLKKF
jgi:hypothetical protein